MLTPIPEQHPEVGRVDGSVSIRVRTTRLSTSGWRRGDFSPVATTAETGMTLGVDKDVETDPTKLKSAIRPHAVVAERTVVFSHPPIQTTVGVACDVAAAMIGAAGTVPASADFASNNNPEMIG